MKKLLAGAVVVLGLSSLASVADAASFGIRTGWPSLLGVQYTMDDNAGLRLIAGTTFGNLAVQGDYLMHMPLSTVQNLSLYYGGGANADIFFGGSISFGVQGTFGVEYAFTPTLSAFWDASLGLDYNTLFGIGAFYGTGVGINFRV
ncbi:MAG TPA: hypothetical protein VHN99_11510 [Deinococcales bacterium]|nr:hypothetical protein [Deinococcales bacterium]